MRYRLARTGGVVTIDTSADSGVTWTTRHTFGASSTQRVYAHYYTVANNVFRNPRQQGMT